MKRAAVMPARSFPLLVLLLSLSIVVSGCQTSSGGGGQILASLTIAPGTATVGTGGTQTFTATGADSDGNPVTVSPEWSLSQENPVGIISPSGSSCVFTGQTAGSATLTASQSSITSNPVNISVTESPPPPTTACKIFFLHHSVGANLISQGNVRSSITGYNTTHGTSYELWDHDYNSTGLINGSGEATGTSYDIPGDNTNPDGLHDLWTSSEAGWASARGQIVAEANAYKVIAFKSCYVALEILDSTSVLDQWKNWYLEMRTYFDAHTDKLFVVMSPPPLRSAETSAASASLARQFANWLGSAEYLSGHSNAVCFDLFDQFAGADNFLKDEYESGDSSHPNELANQTVGPVFADFLCANAQAYF